MSATPRVTALAPFRIRSFRYQWPADLATSWAFEMETLILGWYILVETRSVLLLTLFASLQHMGTLLAPMFGVMGDRVGHRNVACAMRLAYATLAGTLTAFAFMQVLTPVHVFVIAALMGMMRPSDMVMRYSLIGGTVPSGLLISAMSIARATVDSARVVGALAGAGVVAMLGMGPAYLVVTLFYFASFVLTLRVQTAPAQPRAHAQSGDVPARASPWRDLKDVMAHVWGTPHLLAGMWLAFLLNLTAFPLVQGLLPYVAKEIYDGDQKLLGYLVASFASGALLGSVVLSRFGSRIRPARMTLVFSAAWYVTLLVFAWQQSIGCGLVALVFAGAAQSLALVPLSTMLLRTSDASLRGRVLGIRMLAVYGLPIGLMIAGPLISTYGFTALATLYCVSGLMLVAAIAFHWRAHVWRADATANRR